LNAVGDRSESRQDRAARYRKLAKEADDLAIRCTSTQTRESCARIARSWRLLADETESDKF
jgi:hypothetical protein